MFAQWHNLVHIFHIEISRGDKNNMTVVRAGRAAMGSGSMAHFWSQLGLVSVSGLF